MTSLPASIEAYLLEAGFSPTEITILKRLLEGEALTLRELGAKTGKSTGVLDQATKKLLAKKILNRDIINGVPKFTVTSLPSIAAWVEQDMREKREWGTFISASAPIFNKNGEADSILGLDMRVSDFYLKLNARFKFFAWAVSSSIALLSFRLLASIPFLKRINRCFNQKKFVV